MTVSESLADRLRRYRRDIKKKDPELYQKILKDGKLTDQDVVSNIDKVEQAEQQKEK